MADEEVALPDNIFEAIVSLSERGNSFFEKGDSDLAIEVWQHALNLLPSPRNIWQASMWLNASIGEAYREKGIIERSTIYFEDAYASADGFKNPFVLVSLGANLYDLGREEESLSYLRRAYLTEGADIFEEFGEKYLKFVLKN